MPFARCARAAPSSFSGSFSTQPPFDALSLLLKEVRVVGSMTYGHGGHRADFTLALQMLSANIAVVKDLVTHRFKLENIGEAFQAAANKKQGAIKVIVIS